MLFVEFSTLDIVAFWFLCNVSKTACEHVFCVKRQGRTAHRKHTEKEIAENPMALPKSPPRSLRCTLPEPPTDCTAPPIFPPPRRPETDPQFPCRLRRCRSSRMPPHRPMCAYCKLPCTHFRLPAPLTAWCTKFTYYYSHLPTICQHKYVNSFHIFRQSFQNTCRRFSHPAQFPKKRLAKRSQYGILSLFIDLGVNDNGRYRKKNRRRR